jgi:hypothetical protein
MVDNESGGFSIRFDPEAKTYAASVPGIRNGEIVPAGTLAKLGSQYVQLQDALARIDELSAEVEVLKQKLNDA